MTGGEEGDVPCFPDSDRREEEGKQGTGGGGMGWSREEGDVPCFPDSDRREEEGK
jgi:hypothetical protein